MTPWDKIGWRANIPRLQACRDLQAARSGQLKLTREGLYRMVLAATGDRAAAERAEQQYIAAQLRAGQTPE